MNIITLKDLFSNSYFLGIVITYIVCFFIIIICIVEDNFSYKTSSIIVGIIAAVAIATYPSIYDTTLAKEVIKLDSITVQNDYTMAKFDGKEHDYLKKYVKRKNLKKYRGALFYTVLSVFITYGLLFFLVMLPAKIADDARLDQRRTIGIISLLFGGTIIVWIILMIWVNDKKSALLIAKASSSNIEKSASQKIEEVKELLDKGLITQEEYETKRKELLSQI